MTLNYKGFTEEQIQEIIDWKLQMKQIDEMMWKMNAEQIIKKIMLDVINEKSGAKEK